MKLTKKRTAKTYDDNRNECGIKTLANFAQEFPDTYKGIKVKAFRKISGRFGENYIVFAPEYNTWIGLPKWCNGVIDEDIANGDINAENVSNLMMGWVLYTDRNNVERVAPTWEEIEVGVDLPF